MKGSTYPLQTLFELREKAKKETEEAFAKAKQKHDAAKQKLQTMQTDLENMIAARKGKQHEYAEGLRQKETQVKTAQVQQQHVKSLMKQEEDQKEAIEKQRDVVSQEREKMKHAQKIMITASQEYKALEKHKEKWQLEKKKRIENKLEIQADELAQSQFLKSKRGE
jgi:flagellar biosynthesis chaperone FliJ